MTALAAAAGVTVASLAGGPGDPSAGAAGVASRLSLSSAAGPGHLAPSPGKAAAAAEGATSGRVRAAASQAVPGATASPGKQPSPSQPSGALPTPSVTEHVAVSAHRKPYMFYDSLIPQAIPAGKQVATYADGAHPPPVSAVAGRKDVIWIDVTGGDPAAQAIDVEPGCASPSAAAAWVSAKLSAKPTDLAIIYTTISEWSAVRASVSALPAAMQARIRWWIADPTGVPHLVPGSQATQWYWGSSYDISIATWQF